MCCVVHVVKVIELINLEGNFFSCRRVSDLSFMFIVVEWLWTLHKKEGEVYNHSTIVDCQKFSLVYNAKKRFVVRLICFSNNFETIVMRQPSEIWTSYKSTLWNLLSLFWFNFFWVNRLNRLIMKLNLKFNSIRWSNIFIILFLKYCLKYLSLW